MEEGSQTSLFPQFSAAELLKEPLLARMGGLQLKSKSIHPWAVVYLEECAVEASNCFIGLFKFV